VSRPGEFANITGRLVLAVRERQEKSNTRDSETDVFVSKYWRWSDPRSSCFAGRSPKRLPRLWRR
jgi:hypothetical protein